jgi:hypothetical protein
MALFNGQKIRYIETKLGLAGRLLVEIFKNMSKPPGCYLLDYAVHHKILARLWECEILEIIFLQYFSDVR